MRKLSVFNFTTLNGFYKGKKEDISWHKQGAGDEEKEWAAGSANSGSVLLFGRTTYEMMASYWPTPAGMNNQPEVAKGMNQSQKIVFSSTLRKTKWENTTIIKKNIVEEIKKLKTTPGKDLTILGSGSIVTQFAEAGLIDNYLLMIDPIALGGGTSMFKGMKGELNLKLKETRAFKSGVVLLSYEAVDN